MATRKLLEIPIRISSACRQIHACLTGSKARRMDLVDSAAINNVWNLLDRCWGELDQLCHWTIDIFETEEITRFMHGWQVSDEHQLQSDESLKQFFPTDLHIRVL